MLPKGLTGPPQVMDVRVARLRRELECGPRRKPQQLQFRPTVVDGCLRHTGLVLDRARCPSLQACYSPCTSTTCRSLPIAIALPQAPIDASAVQASGNNWHVHHGTAGGGDQILMCTAGSGRYQAEGEAPVGMEPGTVVRVPAGTKHWHGAKADSWFSPVAFITPGEDVGNEWLEPVTDGGVRAAGEERSRPNTPAVDRDLDGEGRRGDRWSVSIIWTMSTMPPRVSVPSPPTRLLKSDETEDVP